LTRQLFSYHPVIGYRFIPGIRARVRHESGGYNVRCNRAGFRCEHEVTPKPKEGVFRVLLFGDSFTAGDGVSNQHRFGDVLEQKISGIEVLNFGLPGSGTDQQYLAFEEYAKGIEYHLLLICPFVENIERIVASHRKTVNFADGKLVERAKPYFTLENGELVLHHNPCPKETRAAEADDWRATDDPLKRNVRKLYDRFPGFSRAVKRIRNIRYPMAYEDPQSPAWLLMKRILEKWIEESNSEVVVCPLPLYAHIDKAFSAEGIRSRFAELAKNDKVTVADILPNYWRMSPEERFGLVYHGDEHPSRRGHEVIAESLEPYVRKFYERWRRNS
jgi:hypothetical protein